MDSINTTSTRAFLYAALTVSAVAVFGNGAEMCDLLPSCPRRLGAVIGLAVTGTVISILLCLGVLKDIEGLRPMETVMCFLLVAIFSACAGVASSVRTNLGNSVALTFSWVSLFLAVLLLFLSGAANACCSNSKLSKDAGEKVYEASGAGDKKKKEDGDDARSSHNRKNEEQV